MRNNEYKIVIPDGGITWGEIRDIYKDAKTMELTEEIMQRVETDEIDQLPAINSKNGKNRFIKKRNG